MFDAASTGGEAFWLEETQKQANAITAEAVFDAFLTPFFSAILDCCGLVFVNSETYRWLSQSTLVKKSTDLKADGFVMHRGMYRGKPVPDDGVPRPSRFRFGVAEEELFDCLILFQSKLSITDAGFGQVARYLEHLCPKGVASATPFDRWSFWMIESHRSTVMKVVKAKSGQYGIESLVSKLDYGQRIAVGSALDPYYSLLGVEVVEGDVLGRGAYGRVFKVRRHDGEVVALKIVETGSVERLHREQLALTNAQVTGLTVRLVGNVVETREGAALLLSPIGKTLSQPTTRQEVRKLFGLLWQLHERGLVHGDPRVPNVISTGKRLCGLILWERCQRPPY